MKRTVSFFNSCLEYISNVVKYSFEAVSLLLIMLIFGVIYFNNVGISGIIRLATNIHSNVETKKVNVEDMIRAYAVFNADNYILNNKETVEKTNSEKSKDIISKDTALFDASAVDAISNIITIDKSDFTKKTTKNYDRIDMYGITIYDYSSKTIDFEDIYEMNINLTKKSDKILMYCTHTSETYTNSENFTFKYSGNFRTKDEKYNMLSVANIMAKGLIEKGMQVVFDTTPHDYTSYDNSYTNSLRTINKNINENSRFGVTIDVHRDAAADLTFAPKTIINGKSTAKLMIVLGVGYDGYPNKYWKENLSLAMHIVKLGEEMYPGLFRQILVRDARYNQHVSPNSILIEVGATGNTLEEAYYGARCFSNVLAKLYK